MADIEITKEMMEAVAYAQLYREDPILALQKANTSAKRIANREMDAIYREILRHPDFKKVKEDAIALETLTNVDDNIDTIQLNYNRLLKKAQAEGKYEVVVRILDKIRQLKAIENEQMKFEIVIKVEEPKE
ncbi:MAG: hypothetical protein NC218_08420 [Acetobacter sp.]|nr:hypothetical protein [Acetobacter sp.]